MRRRRIILCCVLAGAAAGVFVFWPRSEPVYEGKRLSHWLAEASSRQDPARYEQAKRALQAAGTKALPWLMSELTRSEPKWSAALRRLRGSVTGRYPGPSAYEIRSWNAAVGLRLLGPATATALPELDRCLYLGDRRLRDSAAHAMAGGGEAALPYLLKGMTNLQVQFACIYSLGWLAHTTPAATPHLVRLFESPNPQARRAAAMHLIDVASHPELTVPALAIAMWDPGAEVRNFATRAFTHMRSNSAPLAEALRRQMQDANAAVVLTASNALHLLENGPPPDPVTMAEAGESALPYVLRCFASTNITVVTRSITALGVLAPKMEAAVPPLAQALYFTNSVARKLAAVSLSGVRVHPELTIPALTTTLSDSDSEVARAANWRLLYLRNNSAELVAELRQLVAGTNAVAALSASNALYLLMDPSPLRP